MKYDFPILLPVAANKLRQKILCAYYSVRSRGLAWLWGIKTNGPFVFQGRTIVRTRRLHEIELGYGDVFNSNPLTNVVGLAGPTVLDTQGGGHICIGDYSYFSAVVISSRTKITIGSKVNVGGNVRIFDHDFHSTDARLRAIAEEDRKGIKSFPVVIADNCFIGANSIILKGVEIGARSIVAAGSVVVNLKAPPDSLIAGNPARIVKSMMAAK